MKVRSKIELIIVALLISSSCYAADVAQNAVADGSGTVAGTDYLNGYSGATSQRYTINSIFTMKLAAPGAIGGTTPAAGAFTTITVSPSATPTISAKDSDATAGDENTTIVTNCTDVGNGTEDCDQTFNQQIAGTLTAWLNSDADGAITFGTGRPVTVAGILTIYSANDPDLTAEGQLTWDANGDVLRGHDGTRQIAAARVQEEIHVTVIAPNDMADAVRDAFMVWSNESGMSFVVTGWKGWSSTDDTTLNLEEVDADGVSNNATIDAVELATGTGPYTGGDTTITAATIENGHVLLIDFDDTDAPTYVKMVIYGYYAADVN
jgi:hypothetical protein